MLPRFILHIYVVFVLLFGLSAECFAQQGFVRLAVRPGHNFRVMVNGSIQQPTNTLKLLAGTHTLSFWAPDYKPKDTTVTVLADSTVLLVVRLKHTSAWYKYQSEYKAWKQNRTLNRWPPILLAGAGAATTIVFWNTTNNAHREYIDLSYDARFAPVGQRESLRTDADLAYSRYKANRTGTIVSGIATLGCVAWAWYGIKATQKIEPPAKKTPNPWKLSDISLAPHPDGGAIFGLKMTF